MDKPDFAKLVFLGILAGSLIGPQNISANEHEEIRGDTYLAGGMCGAGACKSAPSQQPSQHPSYMSDSDRGYDQNPGYNQNGSYYQGNPNSNYHSQQGSNPSSYNTNTHQGYPGNSGYSSENPNSNPYYQNSGNPYSR